MFDFRKLNDAIISLHNIRNRAGQKYFEFMSSGDNIDKLREELGRIAGVSDYISDVIGHVKQLELLSDIMHTASDKRLSSVKDILNHLSDYDIRNIAYEALSQIAGEFFEFWDGGTDTLFGVDVAGQYTDKDYTYVEEMADLLNGYD